MRVAEQLGTVVSLYDRSGNMVRPWADAGWPCLCLDMQHSIRRDHHDGNITYRWADMRQTTPADLPEPAIIFGFPPCTNLAVSGARDFKRKGLRGLIDALELVESARMLCEWFGVPWMLENPVSRLSSCWREPDHRFQPWQYGDKWTKQTCLWSGGGFVMPEPTVTERPDDTTESIWRMPPSDERANKRSETPGGFARAVYDANARRIMQQEAT